MTNDIKIAMAKILDLERRVSKLEEEKEYTERKELDWALNQFRYMDRTSDESKALAIIEKRLGTKLH